MTTEKYHCKFEILHCLGKANWILNDHTGIVVARGNGYQNYHNALRALRRHIAVIQSGSFSLPPKPLRKPYTFKSKPNENLQAISKVRPHRKGNEANPG